MDRTAQARAYYRALDTDDHESLADLLAPDFRQIRPDRTFEGRERFVRFMREERPQRDTTHPIDAVYAASEGDDAPDRVAVEGRLLDSGGERITAFVDVFTFEGARVAEIRTYVR